VELTGALTKQKTKTFWTGLQGLLKKHSGAVTTDKLVSARAAKKPAGGGTPARSRGAR
jgi:hypothetical protein